MNKPFVFYFPGPTRAQTAQIRPRMADQGISMGQPKNPASVNPQLPHAGGAGAGL